MDTTSIITSTSPLQLKTADTSEVSKATNDFSEILQSTITEVNKATTGSDNAIQELATGGPTNLHDVMIAVEEADISLRMFVQVRNKALEAYDTIMRLQL